MKVKTRRNKLPAGLEITAIGADVARGEPLDVGDVIVRVLQHTEGYHMSLALAVSPRDIMNVLRQYEVPRLLVIARTASSGRSRSSRLPRGAWV